MTCGAHPEVMNHHRTADAPRYDATLRAVMWLDAFWSVAFVFLAPAVALIAALEAPSGVPSAVVIATFVSAVVLALCGAVTGVLLMARMQHGHYYLPDDLRLPLPAFMRPDHQVPDWSISAETLAPACSATAADSTPAATISCRTSTAASRLNALA